MLDAAGEVIRPGEALERHRVRARRAAGCSASSTAARRAGRRRAARCPSPRSRSRKLSWLHRREPDAFARIARVLLPHDWLAWRLTGELGTDRGDASGTGYWSAARPASTALDLLEIVDRGARLGRRAAAGARARARATGTGDNMAAALGLGLRAGRRRDLARHLRHGVRGERRRRPRTRPARCAASPTRPAGTCRSSARSNATKVTDATAHLLGVDLAELDEHGARRPRRVPAASCSCRTSTASARRTAPTRPGPSPGCARTSRREQLARSAFEGVVCGLLDGLDALARPGVATDDGRLFLVGGGARSAAYRQILADLAQRPVVVTAEDELVALGACVQAAARVSGAPIADVQDAWALGDGDDDRPGRWIPTRASAVRAAYASARDSG